MTCECHWPTCTDVVPKRIGFCPRHWYRLPQELRDKLSASYEAGQGVTKDPSDRYVEAEREIQYWIKDNT